MKLLPAKLDHLYLKSFDVRQEHIKIRNNAGKDFEKCLLIISFFEAAIKTKKYIYYEFLSPNITI